ncbi:hypothetical protein QBC47DRAFT_329977 [Echria macrotheca]|uniref:Attractin/MKLN-like beta-propeller domain-containing protein n=1 Tax=Echria macrotheca TaxID=438768 RepID=A0AAJ0F5G4_9PEZI|nr:hypothetical protein QBC47DRAFT_329977 [Echria macrotheca]
MLSRTQRSGSRPGAALLVFVCYLVAFAAAQYDPLKDFCRRWAHQAAVVDDRLYIDGGMVDWKPFSASSQNYTNPFFLYSDLGQTTEGMPTLNAGLSKNATIPTVNGGVLWEDSVNKRLYLYGGEFYQSPPTGFVLYSYDILYDNWISLGQPAGSAMVVPTSYGAGVSISWKGEAYHYGGWFNNASVPGWNGPPQASNRLIKYTMDTNTWSNLTGPDNVRRAEGAMVYIPAGDAGMLVYFGGSDDLYGNGTLTPEPLDRIYLFDIANTKWYSQMATGRIPENRRRFCAGATWAQDQSSYNIYIYGGAGFPPDTTGYDDIYILSIPSFQWIRGPYPADSNSTGPYPKSMMTCNVVNNAQMLVIGGTYSNDTTYMCDADVVWGEHSMDLGKQNPQDAIWALFKPNLTTYVVPTDILTAIGGASTGGAQTTAPVSGFNAPDLSVLMTRKAIVQSRSPTRDVSVPTAGKAHPGSGVVLGTGVIAGIAIGSVVAIIIILTACIICIRRRKKYYAGPRQANQPPPGWAGSNPPSASPAYSYPSPPLPVPVSGPPAELESEQGITPVYYTPARSPSSGKYEAWTTPAAAEMPLPSPTRSTRSRRASRASDREREARGVMPGQPYYSPVRTPDAVWPSFQGQTQSPNQGGVAYEADSSPLPIHPSGIGGGRPGPGTLPPGVPVQPRWDEPRR